jgi:transcription initiation factor TFIID subunit 2
MKLLRELVVEQADHAWQNELRFERDICAQLDACETLSRYASSQSTRTALVSALENNECFFRVRVRAAQILADVFNRCAGNAGPPALVPLVSTFKKFFMSAQAPNIVASNNFNDLQMYFLQKSLPTAMGTLRNAHNLCPSEVIRYKNVHISKIERTLSLIENI